MTKITVTDHAVLRYLERVLEIDTERYRKAILTEENIQIINKLGGTCEIVKHGFTIRVVDYKILTIMKNK